MNSSNPDTAASFAGMLAGLMLVGGGQVMIALLHWMAAK